MYKNLNRRFKPKTQNIRKNLKYWSLLTILDPLERLLSILGKKLDIYSFNLSVRGVNSKEFTYNRI